MAERDRAAVVGLSSLVSATKLVRVTSSVTAESRHAALASEISRLVARGRRIQSRDDFSAVLARDWGPFERREIVRVDEFGNTSVDELLLTAQQLFSLAGVVVGVVVVLLIVVTEVLG